MVVDISSDRGYNGLLKAVSTDHQSNPADILDDLEESYDTANLDISSNQSSNDLSGLNDAVREISKGVSEKTAQEYLRYVLFIVQYSFDNLFYKTYETMSSISDWTANDKSRKPVFLSQSPSSSRSIYCCLDHGIVGSTLNLWCSLSDYEFFPAVIQ